VITWNKQCTLVLTELSFISDTAPEQSFIGWSKRYELQF